jgi:hypothetical protein
MSESLIYRVPTGINEMHWLHHTVGPLNPLFKMDQRGWYSMSGYVWMDEPTYLLYTLKYGEYV